MKKKFASFNSPEGIRLIDTKPDRQGPTVKGLPFNSPEGIRLIDTPGSVPGRSVEASDDFQLP